MYGPLPQTFDSKALKVFLDGERDLSKVDLALAFTRFARRAFRRPVSKSEIEPYLTIERNARMKLWPKPSGGFLLALKAMLVSPDFLYLKKKIRVRTVGALRNRQPPVLFSLVLLAR